MSHCALIIEYEATDSWPAAKILVEPGGEAVGCDGLRRAIDMAAQVRGELDRRQSGLTVGCRQNPVRRSP